jgi:hypothetical protein
MGQGKTNKRKGHDAERLYANFFREIGFEFCETSRFASRKHDNAKIDLVYIPFNIQIKAGKQTGMNPGKELCIMESAMQMMFPKEDEVFSKPRLLIHSKQVGRGFKRLPEHEIVYMSMKQFELFKEKSADLTYHYHKVYKFELDSEYRTIVGMDLEVFKNEVILKHYTNGSCNNTTSRD